MFKISLRNILRKPKSKEGDRPRSDSKMIQNQTMSLEGKGQITMACALMDILNQEEKGACLDLIILAKLLSPKDEIRYVSHDQLAALLQVKPSALCSVIEKAQALKKLKIIEKAIIPSSHKPAEDQKISQTPEMSSSGSLELSAHWARYWSITLLGSLDMTESLFAKSGPLALFEIVSELTQLIHGRIKKCERKGPGIRTLERRWSSSPILQAPIKDLPKEIIYYDPINNKSILEFLNSLGKGISLWDEDPVKLRQTLMAQRVQVLIEFKALYFTLLGKPETRKALFEEAIGPELAKQFSL